MAYCGLILRNLILIGKSLEYSLTLCITEKSQRNHQQNILVKYLANYIIVLILFAIFAAS